MFNIEKKLRKFTPLLHFYTSIRVFDRTPKDKIKFECKSCGEKLFANLGRVRNLNAHLLLDKDDKHKQLRDWYNLYSARDKTKCELTMISEEELDLIRYFISSNTALSQLENKHLQKILSNKLKLPCIKNFRYKFLQKLMDDMHSVIEEKLEKAYSISISTDIWTNKANIDFCAVVASITNLNLDREIIVSDLTTIEGKHSAENVKVAVEKILNTYKFDKSKLHGKSLFNTK